MSPLRLMHAVMNVIKLTIEEKSMSDNQGSTIEPQFLSTKDDAAKTHALIAYGLMVVGMFTGIFWIAGAIWAIVKREEAKGTIYEDHYSNIINTFWWMLGLLIVGYILISASLSLSLSLSIYVSVTCVITLLAVWILSAYKIIKGLAKITSNKAYNS